MDHPRRKLQKAFRIFAVGLALALISGAASADKLIKPVNGATVREVVRIAVDPATVPPGGYISVYIDKHFVGAAAQDTPTDPDGKPLRAEPLVFPWDSKKPFEDTGAVGGKELAPKDGPHDLKIDIHNPSGGIAETINSRFNLANKVARLSPNDKYKLSYRYRAGGITTYKVTVDTHVGGSSYSTDDPGTSPLSATYRLRQTVEDARADGTALVSYQVAPGGSCRVLGQVVLINGGQAGSSVYKEVDRFGQIIRRDGLLQNNVLAKKGRRSLPDVLLQLPRRAVKIGETWQAVEKEDVSIEGIGDVVGLSCTATLEDLVWERGQECARIKCKLNGTGRLVANDKNPTPGRIDGEGIYYIGLKTGKMISSSVTLSEFVNIDAASVSGASPSSSSSYTPPGASSYSDDGDDGAGNSPYRSPTSAPSAAPATGGGGIVTSGTMRFIIDTRL